MRGEERQKVDNEIVKHQTRPDQTAAEEQTEDLIKLPSVQSGPGLGNSNKRSNSGFSGELTRDHILSGHG